MAKAEDSIGMLYETVNQKVNYLIFVGRNKVNKHPANKLIKEISRIIGGGGGGRSHLAEGGGGNPAKIKEAAAYLKNIIKQ